MQAVLEIPLAKTTVIDYDGAVNSSLNCYESEEPTITVFNNQAIYTGTYKNGLFHGKGKYQWPIPPELKQKMVSAPPSAEDGEEEGVEAEAIDPEGVTYEGSFSGGYMEGSGIYRWPDGSMYKGGIHEGKRHGHGIFESSTGQLYEGEWKHGLKHGQGTLYFNYERSIVYKGEWKHGKRHGYGIMTYASGNVYEGEWAEDKKHGRGVMTWKASNEIYLGSWYQDKPHGYGEHIWNEQAGKVFQHQHCNIYRGFYAQGLREGHGTFFYGNSGQYSGTWVQNKKHGPGVFISATGKISYGIYELDRIISTPMDIYGGTAGTGSTGANAKGGGSTGAIGEGDTLTPQFYLNISDLLDTFPQPSSSTSAKSPKYQVQELERLLLRYHSILRQLLKRYASSNQTWKTLKMKYGRRQKHSSLLPPANWTQLQSLFYAKRDWNEKLFCLTVTQLCQFAREMNLLSTTFSAYDVYRVIADMHVNHQVTAARQRLLYQRSNAIYITSGGDKSPRHGDNQPQDGETIDQLLNQSFESDATFDSTQPLRDREFVEAMVRVIAESACRRHEGSPGVGLFDVVYRFLAEKVEPLVSEAQKPPLFIIAYYSEAVQTVLIKYMSALRSLWDQVCDISKEHQPSGVESEIQLRHILKLFQALRGTVIFEDASLDEIIRAIHRASSTAESVEEVANLLKPVCFDDFVELFCRLVVSDLWTHGQDDAQAQALAQTQAQEQPQAQQQGLADTVVKSDTLDDNSAFTKVSPVQLVETTLCKRLTAWLQLI